MVVCHVNMIYVPLTRHSMFDMNLYRYATHSKNLEIKCTINRLAQSYYD